MTRGRRARARLYLITDTDKKTEKNQQLSFLSPLGIRRLVSTIYWLKGRQLLITVTIETKTKIKTQTTEMGHHSWTSWSHERNLEQFKYIVFVQEFLKQNF